MKLGECLATSIGGSRWLSACKLWRSIARLNGNLVCRTDIYSFGLFLTNFSVPRRYKTSAFAEQLLSIIHALRLPVWCNHEITPQTLKIQKVSGSLTNAVFFVSNPSIPHAPILLLRIYGPSSGSLISRPRELHTLHILSSQYHIGPKVYGTFENGRVEEYFESTALTAEDMRDPIISSWIGARMAELHCVDIEAIDGATSEERGEGVGWEIAARRSIREWLAPAREVLQLQSVDPVYKAVLDFDRFIEEWKIYMEHLAEWERVHGASKRVFAHNDTQYGNLLRLRKVKEGTPEHQQV